MRDEGARVVVGDSVEDHAGVGPVGRVAVRGPAAGAEVEFDIAAEDVAAGIEDGAGVIGAGGATGHAGEDDVAPRHIVTASQRVEQ